MNATVIKDASGRIVITEKDDRGEPEAYIGPTVDCRGLSAFVEKETISFRRNPDLKKGSYVLGLVLVSGTVIDGTSADMVALEVNLLGYIGSGSSIIRRMVFGPGAGLQLVRFDTADTFDRIAFEARQIVNGAPSSLGTLQAVALQVSGRFYR